MISSEKAENRCGNPEFIPYTDPELKMMEGKENPPSVALQQRLCQCTISNMVSATQNLDEPRYPTLLEVKEVPKHFYTM